MSIIDNTERGLDKPMTEGAMRQILGDMMRANGNEAGARALVGEPHEGLTRVMQITGLNREQIKERTQSGILPSPDAYDGNNSLWNEQSLQRMQDVVDNEAVWSSGRTATEDTQDAAEQKESNIRFSDYGEEHGLNPAKLASAFRYQGLTVKRSDQGVDYMTEADAEHMTRQQEAGRLFATGTTAPTAAGEA